MKRIILFMALIFSFSLLANDVQNLCKILEIRELALKAKAQRQSPASFCRTHNGVSCNSATTFPKSLCLIFDGDKCDYTRSMYDGVCRANNGSGCSLTRSPGNGICRSLNGELCAHTRNIAAGICRGLRGINCRFVDSEWEMSYWMNKFQDICPQVNIETL